MWFAALGGNINQNEYLIMLLAKLFSNSKTTLTLIKHNPFPNKPPSYIKIEKYIYHYTDPEEFEKTGKYWKREL